MLDDDCDEWAPLLRRNSRKRAIWMVILLNLSPATKLGRIDACMAADWTELRPCLEVITWWLVASLVSMSFSEFVFQVQWSQEIQLSTSLVYLFGFSNEKRRYHIVRTATERCPAGEKGAWQRKLHRSKGKWIGRVHKNWCSWRFFSTQEWLN